MKKLISKMKLFHLILLSLAGLLILSALPFKTQYSFIYVNVNSALGIEQAGASDTNPSLKQDQKNLYNFFEVEGLNGFVDNDGKEFAHDFNQYKVNVYNFEQDLNNLNDLILIFGIVTFIGVAILYIFGNNNRRIYYKSNLIASTVFTAVVVGFSIAFIIKSLSVMSTFSANSNLYNYVSVLQNPDYNIEALSNAQDLKSIQYTLDHFTCDVTTFVVYDIFVVLFMAYCLFMFVLTFVKYNATAERRKELEKVVATND